MATHDAVLKPGSPVRPGRRLLERVEREEGVRARAERRATLLGRVLFAAVFFLGWELSSGRLVEQFFVSKPSAIASSLWAMLTKESLLYHLQFTIIEATAGYLVGAASGLILGFALARVEVVYRIIEPFLVAFYGIPRNALAPLFIL